MIFNPGNFISTNLPLRQQFQFKVNRVENIEFEYAAPGKLQPKHLLGESGGKQGANQTSPDVAVTFDFEKGRSGIYLIENKYTEHSFYPCSVAKIVRKEGCSNASKTCENSESMCSQEDKKWGRRYWTILQSSGKLDSLKNIHCPALYHGYQLLRHQALAQGIADSGLFDLVISGVAYDSRNSELISCLRDIGLNDFATDWASLFKSENVRFTCFEHQNLVGFFKQSDDEFAKNWVEYITERYNY